MSSAGRRPPVTWRVPWLAVMSRLQESGRGPDGTGAWPRTSTARRWAVDAAIAAAVTAVQVGATYGSSSWHRGQGHAGVLAYVLLVVAGAALLARRRYPVGVLAVPL